MRLPVGLRQAITRVPLVGAAVRRIDPLREPTYVWTLSEPMAGVRFTVVEAAERQYVTGPYEPAVVRAVQSIVKPGTTCVDAGAHIGYMTLAMARAAGAHGCVVAFEPSEANCSRLRENLALNSVENVVVVRAFVSVRDGQVHLASGPSSFEHRLELGGESDTAPSVALDGYFDGTKVDFVKLDVEGADELAVDGMRRILSQDKPVVLIEDHGAATRAAKAILAAHGYIFSDVDAAHSLATPS